MNATTPIPSATAIDPITTIILPLVLGISGWFAFFYQYYSDKPKIKGKILQVMQGTIPNPQKTSEQMTAFFLFLYLTNTRKNAIHLRFYDLEVDFGEGFKKLNIIRGFQDNFSFFSATGEIIFPGFVKGLIYKQSKPIEFGVPFYGYLVFGGDLEYHGKTAKRFKMTITDVFDHKHVFYAKPDKDFIDIYFLQELFGIKLPTNIPVGSPTTKKPQQGINLQERKKRLLDSIPETVRLILSDYFTHQK